jgi:hypothetical protein
VLDCQTCDTPNLKDFAAAPDDYDCIIFDEGSWEVLYHNKLLFQAGPKPVMLGQTRTNVYAYKVLVYMVPMIICSNQFFRGCKDAEVLHYVQNNIIYHKVTGPCWHDPRDTVQADFF